MLQMKTITLVLKVSTYIMTSITAWPIMLTLILGINVYIHLNAGLYILPNYSKYILSCLFYGDKYSLHSWFCGLYFPWNTRKLEYYEQSYIHSSLYISASPVVTVGSNSYTVVKNQNIDLVCTIVATPAATNVQWYRNVNGVQTGFQQES
jgi:hypothetical protein